MRIRNLFSKTRIFTLIAALTAILMPVMAFAAEEEEYVPSIYGTAWAVVPPVIAIVLALITKEVYSSLFFGIVVGGVFWSIGSGSVFTSTFNHVLNDGFIASLADSWNVGILVFLVVLGAVVALMNKTGGSAAFGKWAETHIKTRKGAQFATIVLGIVIFIDDYFNCLTVGSVMRPVADEHKISRAKLSYLIDATAAPICIIAPISSWAAAVTGFVPGEDGFKVFLQAIPYNFYAILTIVMMFVIVGMKFDYGPMKRHENNAIEHGDLFTTEDRPYENVEDMYTETKGKVIDLVIPIIVLIVLCALGMLYTGGFFDGENIVNAFSNSDASVGLSLGSIFAIIIIIAYYLCRRLISFKDSMNCLPAGFKAMVPAILILTFAWTLKAMTDSLGCADFVAGLVESGASGFMNFLPAIVFIVGCVLAFASGTSWGTFGILIPIVVPLFAATDHTMMIMSISACMAGAVCGDHCSPISDTTIMASAGGQCNHINHVNTQLPYAITVAAVSFVSYIICGFVKNIVVCLPIAVILMIATLLVIKKITNGRAKA